MESESYGGRKKVEFVIAEEETAALDWAALRIVGPRGYDIGPGLMNADLNTTLHLDVIATEEDARTVATEIYARIRELGRLPAAPDPQISLVALVAGVPVDADEHIFEAQRFRDEQRFELAVIEAQIHCEMQVRYFMELVAANHSNVVLALVRNRRTWSLLDQPGQQLFTILLDRRPAEFPQWNEYRLHVNRRNDVAHRGVRVTRDDATASINVVVALRFFVEKAADEAVAEILKQREAGES